MINLLRKISFLLFAFSGYWLLVTGYSWAEPSKQIRVNIIDDAESLALRLNGFYELVDCSTQKVWYRGRNLMTTVTVVNDSIGIAGRYCRTSCILIKTEGDAPVSINNRLFRGDIKVLKKENRSLCVINQINLEDYVKGIMYHEVSHFWPEDALKAQAVVSRTYALYRMQENKAKDFDVTSDTYAQVYGGRTSERFRTSKAVDDTEGQALVYQGNVIPAYFHATCGGHTEDAAVLWNTNLPPLKGVVCPFCTDSPHYRWHEVMSLDALSKKLAENKYNVKTLTGITIAGCDASGRITALRFVSDGKELEIPAKDFRTAIGPNVIRSTNFEVSIVDTDVVFEGLGWGHGVGLCQWGAYFMAKDGHTYQEILAYYYPGTDIKRDVQ